MRLECVTLTGLFLKVETLRVLKRQGIESLADLLESDPARLRAKRHLWLDIQRGLEGAARDYPEATAAIMLFLSRARSETKSEESQTGEPSLASLGLQPATFGQLWALGIDSLEALLEFDPAALRARTELWEELEQALLNLTLGFKLAGRVSAFLKTGGPADSGP